MPLQAQEIYEINFATNLRFVFPAMITSSMLYLEVWDQMDNFSEESCQNRQGTFSVKMLCLCAFDV